MRAIFCGSSRLASRKCTSRAINVELSDSQVYIGTLTIWIHYVSSLLFCTRDNRGLWVGYVDKKTNLFTEFEKSEKIYIYTEIKRKVTSNNLIIKKNAELELYVVRLSRLSRLSRINSNDVRNYKNCVRGTRYIYTWSWLDDQLVELDVPYRHSCVIGS